MINTLVLAEPSRQELEFEKRLAKALEELHGKPYQVVDRRKRGHEELQELVDFANANFAKDSLMMARCLQMQANNLDSNHAESLQHRQQALAIYQKHSKFSEYQSLASYSILPALMQKGQWKEAARMAEQSFAALKHESDRGDSHLEKKITVMAQLAECYVGLNEFDKACQLYQQLEGKDNESSIAIYLSNRDTYIGSLLQYSLLLNKAGRESESKNVLRRMAFLCNMPMRLEECNPVKRMRDQPLRTSDDIFYNVDIACVLYHPLHLNQSLEHLITAKTAYEKDSEAGAQGFYIYADLAYVYCLQDKLTESVQFFQLAARLAEKHQGQIRPKAYDTMYRCYGYLLKTLGRGNECAQCLRHTKPDADPYNGEDPPARMNDWRNQAQVSKSSVRWQ